MNVYICMCLFCEIRVCVCVYNVRIYIYIYIYIYICIYIYIYTNSYAYACANVGVSMSMSTSLSMSMVTYVHMCVNGEIETQGDTTGRQRLLVGMQTTPSANTKVPSRTTQQLLLNIALHHKFQEAERTCRTEEHCIAKLSYSTAQKAMCQPTRF